jgi:ABC-2 type transport system permease protein
LKTSSSLLPNELIKTRAFVYKNWTMAKRNVFTLFEILFWPVVGFFSVGLLTEFAGMQPQMKAFVLVGVVSMGAIQVCQLDVAYVLLYDVWSKALKHGFIAPVGIRHLLLGSLIVGMARGAAMPSSTSISACPESGPWPSSFSDSSSAPPTWESWYASWC